jgi:uncharacterized protein (TIGR00369 family)
MAGAPANTLSDERRDAIRASFERQGMMKALGACLIDMAPGRVVVALPYSAAVSQQHGTFHGGAIGALADIAGGYAGMSVLAAGSEVTTVEYKINLLAARSGGELRATGRVVRAGNRVVVTQADVEHVAEDGRRTALAVMQQTLVPVDRSY